jgi:hypothetical protein
MPRKPTDTIQVNLRIKEALRRRLEAAAKKRDVSLNFEMVDRLKESFDRADLTSLSGVTTKIALASERLMHFARQTADRELLDNLREASAALVSRLPTDSEDLKDAVDWVREALSAAERKYGQITHD